MLFFNVVYLITAAVSDEWLNLYHGASLQSDIIRERKQNSYIHIGVYTCSKELNKIFCFIIFIISFTFALKIDDFLFYFFSITSMVLNLFRNNFVE